MIESTYGTESEMRTYGRSPPQISENGRRKSEKLKPRRERKMPENPRNAGASETNHSRQRIGDGNENCRR